MTTANALAAGISAPAFVAVNGYVAAFEGALLLQPLVAEAERVQALPMPALKDYVEALLMIVEGQDAANNGKILQLGDEDSIDNLFF